MEINNHISFREKDAKDLAQYLNKNGILYEAGEIISCFDIYESSPYWKEIVEYVKKYQLLCISEMQFTKKELCEAEWMTVRSQWRNGYPQPEDDFKYETITYTRENHCQECGSGLEQVEAFCLKHAPKWGKRHFMMLNWVEDELFVDETVKVTLQEAGISGISFREVKNKKGNEIYPDVYQLIVHHQLEAGCVEEKSGLRGILVCPSCNVKKFHPNGRGMLAFRREIFENAPNVVKTSEYFGWGKYAAREIIVRQNVYQIIVKNHLERGLVFEPIDLVER